MNIHICGPDLDITHSHFAYLKNLMVFYFSHNKVLCQTLTPDYIDENTPDYMDELFSLADYIGIPTWCSYQKLKLPKHKTTQRLRALSYLGPSLWNNLDISLKKSVSLLNAFQRSLFQRSLFPNGE